MSSTMKKLYQWKGGMVEMWKSGKVETCILSCILFWSMGIGFAVPFVRSLWVSSKAGPSEAVRTRTVHPHSTKKYISVAILVEASKIALLVWQQAVCLLYGDNHWQTLGAPGKQEGTMAAQAS